MLRFPGFGCPNRKISPNFRDEHSVDQYRSRQKLSENFEHHWSIQISGEIHMDQSLVHTFSWGNSYGPMVLKVLRKFPPTLVLVHGWLFPENWYEKRKFPQISLCWGVAMRCQRDESTPESAQPVITSERVRIWVFLYANAWLVTPPI